MHNDKNLIEAVVQNLSELRIERGARPGGRSRFVVQFSLLFRLWTKPKGENQQISFTCPSFLDVFDIVT
jgi:hypothetical protein